MDRPEIERNASGIVDDLEKRVSFRDAKDIIFATWDLLKQLAKGDYRWGEFPEPNNLPPTTSPRIGHFKEKLKTEIKELKEDIIDSEEKSRICQKRISGIQEVLDKLKDVA